MKAAKLLVMPSRWYEGFPVTLAEAYACGLPVVASRIGSLAELVRPGITGDLVAPGDERELALRLRVLLGSPETLKRMSIGGSVKI